MTDKKDDKKKDTPKVTVRDGMSPTPPQEKKETNFDKMMKGMLSVPPLKKKKKEDE